MRRVIWLSLLSLILSTAPAARGQISGIQLHVDASSIGIDGTIRLGTWAGMRIRVRNQSADYRRVICRWLIHDHDGDTVANRRTLTLNPERSQRLWLYGVPGLRRARGWRVQVMDAKTGQLLAQRQVGVGRQDVLGATTAVIGVCADSDLGLGGYQSRATRQGKMRLLDGLSLANLPDRWYGLAALQALVWTGQSVSPNAPSVSDATLRAVRQWVSRGGQLVIVMPLFGSPWLSSSLADMLPVSKGQVQRVNESVPSVLGPIRHSLGPLTRISVHVFDVKGSSQTSVLARDNQGRPIIVSKHYGLGSVTMIGVDLSSAKIRRMGLPFGKYRIWNQIFGWESPVLARATIASEIENGHMSRPSARPAINLDRFVPSLIAMHNTAGPAVLAAIIVFGIYWLLAGPVGFAVLRRKGLVRFSWLAFLAVVVVFSVVCWGGGWFLRPGKATISHFSVATINAQSGVAEVESWLSLFVPHFGRVKVAIDPDHPKAENTMASPGLFASLNHSGFIDAQTYRLSSAAPNHADVPVRATAKQLQLTYRGRLNIVAKGLPHPWPLPSGSVSMRGVWPTGMLRHNLPEAMSDVLVVYCPGDGQTPWVWRYGNWPPHQALNLARLVQHQAAQRLVIRPKRYRAKRDWTAEGFLGELIALRTGVRFAGVNPLSQSPGANEVTQAIEMLSFYDELPPPNFRDTSFDSRATTYLRSVGRGLDLSPLTHQRCVIIMGQLKQSPLPMPLTVDGAAVPSHGWTVIRWVYDL